MNTQLIDKRLEQKQKEYAFYGNIRVVKADKVLVDRTFGYANDADKLPIPFLALPQVASFLRH